MHVLTTSRPSTSAAYNSDAYCLLRTDPQDWLTITPCLLFLCALTMLVKHGNEIWDCLIVPRLFPFGTSQPSSVKLVPDPYRREAAFMNHVLISPSTAHCLLTTHDIPVLCGSLHKIRRNNPIRGSRAVVDCCGSPSALFRRTPLT